MRSWFVDGIVKEHRTVATYVNAVIDTGFVLDRIVEWGPTAEDVEARPELADDRHRPWFLLLRATRTLAFAPNLSAVPREDLALVAGQGR